MTEITIESGNRIIAEELGFRIEKTPCKYRNYNIIEWVDSEGNIVYAGGDSWSLTDEGGKDYTIPFDCDFNWLIKAWAKVKSDVYPDLRYRASKPDCRMCYNWNVEFHAHIDCGDCHAAFLILCKLILWKRENLK